MGEERALVRPRFDRGCRCFAAIVDGGVAGYGWLSVGPEWIGELQLEIRPGPGEGYVWNCVTLPAHRRRGVFNSMLLGIREVAAREGLRRLWIGSVAIPAERAVEPAGFRPALHFTTWAAARLLWRRTVPAADSSLASAALQVLGLTSRQAVHRSARRRH